MVKLINADMGGYACHVTAQIKKPVNVPNGIGPIVNSLIKVGMGVARLRRAHPLFTFPKRPDHLSRLFDLDLSNGLERTLRRSLIEFLKSLYSLMASFGSTFNAFSFIS